MYRIGMEAPVSFEANEIRNKKVDVLNAIRKIKKMKCSLMQSADNIVMDGYKVSR
jgi:glucose-6-phosphate 1-dehydrogenase